MLQPFRVVDDDRVKTVVDNGVSLFSSTGIADLRRTRRVMNLRNQKREVVNASFWLAEVLATCNSPDEILEVIPRELHEALNDPRIPRPSRRQAIYGVGWVSHSPGAPIIPTTYRFSNLQNITRLEVGREDLPEGEDFNFSSSLELPRDTSKGIDRTLRDRVSRGNDPAEVAAYLVTTLRAVADFTPTLGKGVLVTCLPRNLIDSALKTNIWKFKAGRPSLDCITFDYYSADKDVGIYHGPSISIGGLVAGNLNMDHNGVVDFGFHIGS